MDRFKEFLNKIVVNKVVWIAIAMVIGIGSGIFFGNDNAVEQLSEEVIYQETGERVDLSPEQMK